MANTYSQQYDIASNPAFQLRICQAIVQAALAISNESIGQPNHPNRVRLAVNVLANPVYWGSKMAFAIVSSGTIDNGALDSDIYTMVASIWDSYAGTL